MSRLKFISVSVVGLFACLSSALSWPHVRGGELPSTVEQKVGPIKLENEYLVDGLAKLNMQTQGVGFAIEFLPGTPNSPPPPDPRFTTEKDAGTLGKALDWLCDLDPRYTWKLQGRTINIIPRDRFAEPTYLFNRRLSGLTFVDLTNADDSLEKIFKPIVKPSESVISLSSAGSFAKPWTATFEDITVRDALNRVAENLGAGHGWMVYGNDETRIIDFYALLLTKAEADKRRKQNGIASP